MLIQLLIKIPIVIIYSSVSLLLIYCFKNNSMLFYHPIFQPEITLKTDFQLMLILCIYHNWEMQCSYTFLMLNTPVKYFKSFSIHPLVPFLFLTEVYSWIHSHNKWPADLYINQAIYIYMCFKILVYFEYHCKSYYSENSVMKTFE